MTGLAALRQQASCVTAEGKGGGGLAWECSHSLVVVRSSILRAVIPSVYGPRLRLQDVGGRE